MNGLLLLLFFLLSTSDSQHRVIRQEVEGRFQFGVRLTHYTLLCVFILVLYSPLILDDMKMFIMLPASFWSGVKKNNLPRQQAITIVIYERVFMLYNIKIPCVERGPNWAPQAFRS
jgi:hypothetical protein